MTISGKKKKGASSSSKPTPLLEQMSGGEQHIEEHGQGNQALLDSAAVYRLIVDNANEAIIIAQDGMLRFVNPKASQISGYSHDELMSMSFVDLIHPEDRQMVLERHQQRLRGKKVPGVYTFRIVNKKGKTKWLEINSVLSTWQGRPATLNLLNDVTRRKQMEARLQASEKRFKELANSLPEIVFELDKKGNFTFVNHPIADSFGYAQDDLAGGMNFRQLLQLVACDNLPRAKERFRRVLKGQSFGPTTYTGKRKDGSTVSVDIYSRPFIRGNRIVGLRGIAVDITKRKEAERKLRSSEEQLRILFELAPDGLFVTDMASKIISANKMAAELAGFNRSELIGRNLSELGLLPPEETLKAADYSRRYRLGQPAKTNEFVINRKDGKRVFIDVKTLAVDIEGQGVLFTVVRDITERKQAEERLFQSEQRYRLLAEHVGDVILTADLTMRPTYISPSITNLLGYTVDEAMARTAPEGLSPASFELVMEASKEAMMDEGKKTLGRTDKSRMLELKLLHKNGSTVPVELKFTFIRDGTGKVTEILIVARDISHRKEIEAQFLAYQEELRSLASELSLAEERERHRIAMEVHDRLSQDLAVCHMKLEALVKSLPSISSNNYIREIQTMVRQLIDATRSIAFEFSSPLLYDFGLEAAVDQLIEQNQKQHRIHFNFKHEGQDKLLDSDTRVLLYQIVRELLVNIRKHAQARHARVCMKRHNNDFRIIVEDDGVGFDMSGVNPERKGNKGFGLFSIRERLKYIGGQIEIKSKPGQGTHVTIGVPLKQEQGQ